VIYLSTILFLYQKYHPENGRFTGRNLSV